MERDAGDDGAVPVPHRRPKPEVAPLTSVVVEHDDGPDTCTLYPPGAREEAPVTRWLSGTGDAFVDLDDAR